MATRVLRACALKNPFSCALYLLGLFCFPALRSVSLRFAFKKLSRMAHHENQQAPNHSHVSCVISNKFNALEHHEKNDIVRTLSLSHI